MSTAKNRKTYFFDSILCEYKMVRGAGLEPACLTAKDPKSFVSANFTSRA